jgi:LysM repeat protein
MPIHNPHHGLLQASVEAIRACYPRVGVGALCVVGFALVVFAGCSELEPMREPEVVDLELTTDMLKASVRDAQRMVAELRADLEARRRELAETQIARAQLEGRVRETERRIIEARQVIELQREELAAARTERAQAFRNSLQLQGQMRQLQKPLSRARKSSPAHDSQKAVPFPSSGAIHKGQKTVQVPAQRNQSSEFPETPQMVATSAALMPVPANSESLSEVELQGNPKKHVSVKSGDTLWNIAQKYHVNVEQLQTLNQLTNNRIVIGQTLWLPDDRPMLGASADKGTPTP